jgi:hypothetical protein
MRRVISASPAIVELLSSLEQGTARNPSHAAALSSAAYSAARPGGSVICLLQRHRRMVYQLAKEFSSILRL